MISSSTRVGVVEIKDHTLYVYINDFDADPFSGSKCQVDILSRHSGPHIS